jgi:hypothetical protein
LVVRHCSECGVELEGRHRVTCGSAKCREARFKRLHPESYAKREVAKVERRRERRRELRGREMLPAAVSGGGAPKTVPWLGTSELPVEAR